MPQISALDHLVLTVNDFDKTIAFYTECLGMKVEKFHPNDGTTRWALSFGAQKINLHQAGQEFKPNAHTACVGSADLCFLSETPLQDWQAHFEKCDVVIEEGPVKRSGATGPIMSLYTRDPDGNLIEISNAV